MKRMVDDKVVNELISKLADLETKVEDLEDRVEALEQEQQEE